MFSRLDKDPAKKQKKLQRIEKTDNVKAEVKVNPKNSAPLYSFSLFPDSYRRSKLSTEERMEEDLGLAKKPFQKLVIAAQYGHMRLARQLLDEGIRVNAHPGEFTTTPLYNAALSGHLEMVKLLVNSGADVNQPSTGNLQNTPLNIAITAGNMDVFDYLLEQHADPNIKSLHDCTALHKAVEVAERNLELAEEFIKKLIAAGTKTQQNSDGYTPLELVTRPLGMCLSGSKKNEIVKRLQKLFPSVAEFRPPSPPR